MWGKVEPGDVYRPIWETRASSRETEQWGQRSLISSDGRCLSASLGTARLLGQAPPPHTLAVSQTRTRGTCADPAACRRRHGRHMDACIPPTLGAFPINSCLTFQILLHSLQGQIQQVHFKERCFHLSVRCRCWRVSVAWAAQWWPNIYALNRRKPNAELGTLPKQSANLQLWPEGLRKMFISYCEVQEEDNSRTLWGSCF